MNETPGQPPADAGTEAQPPAQEQADADVASERAGSGGESPSEEELREAYAAELRRISSADLILQTAASLINVGAYRLGLAGGDPADRDLEQVRDAIDGVRALLPILERRGDAEQLRPLREALSQLQLAYAREAQAGAPAAAAGSPPEAGGAPRETGGDAPGGNTDPAQRPGDARRPGPAESSGRLWTPGKG
jgi:hypothetical protein